MVRGRQCRHSATREARIRSQGLLSWVTTVCFLWTSKTSASGLEVIISNRYQAPRCAASTISFKQHVQVHSSLSRTTTEQTFAATSQKEATQHRLNMPTHKHWPSSRNQDTGISESSALPFLFLASPPPLQQRFSLDRYKKDLDFGSERSRYLKAKSVRTNNRGVREFPQDRSHRWAAFSCRMISIRNQQSKDRQ